MYQEKEKGMEYLHHMSTSAIISFHAFLLMEQKNCVTYSFSFYGLI